MKIKDLKVLIADFPDDARIFQPSEHGIVGILHVTHKGSLIATIDLSKTGYDSRQHKQPPQKAAKPVNQKTDSEFFRRPVT